MNENEFTGPDGTRYQAVASTMGTWDTSCCFCALASRPDSCPTPRRWPGEPRCTKSNREDRRNIYWVLAEVDPNPL